MNALEALQQHTVIVADTGRFELLQGLAARDATTNPSLILKALDQAVHQDLLTQIKLRTGADSEQDRLLALVVAFGVRLLEIVPGRVSTEVDARLSFDTQATISQAKTIIDHYAQQGVSSHRVLIKIAATWEGIRAAEQLERDGVRCNLTLLFSLPQALACADAGVTLVSPFVGRISDWFKARGDSWDSSENDPGVRFVRTVYALYKHRGVQTEVMGASFRNVEQVLALSGCDLLTVSPDLLNQLAQMPSSQRISVALGPNLEPESDIHWRAHDEALFRFLLNEDAMASEKLAEGIRIFARDGAQLQALLSA